MENFDPLGIHTGDSIVVAPSQTLTNDEYNMLREASLKIANFLGIVGECNVQLTLDPESAEYRVIEVNPRLSRSSALASKATGYPIAAVAAELCYGKELHCITNQVTGNTSANFEPSLDYIVVKIPKWDTSKFAGVDDQLGSAMQSVGEVMAIGRNFEETFQKALRMATGYEFEVWGPGSSIKTVESGLRNPTPDRVRLLAHALFEHRLPLEWVHELTRIDRWFLTKLQNIVNMSYKQVHPYRGISWESAKSMGFSDQRLMRLVGRETQQSGSASGYRKNIDTVAGEYYTRTNYHYLTYSADTDESSIRDSSAKTIIVLGSGKYRIGSSVEFDYATVGCVQTLKKLGYRTVVVNYNPETMSTDYDVTDALYFEEISGEAIQNNIRKGESIWRGGVNGRSRAKQHRR